MRTRGVIGKRIVAIEQRRGNPGGQRPVCNDVLYLVLEDGTRLYPHTIETEVGEYWHEIIVNTVNKTKKGQTT